MKFLILTQYYFPEVGASQTRLAAIAKQLIVKGHNVEIVTAMPNHPTGRIFEKYRNKFYNYDITESIKIHRVWLYASTGIGYKRILNYLSFTFTCIFGLMRCKKPDFIFVESPPLFLSIPAFIFSKIWRKPIIFNVADLWPDSIHDLGIFKEGFILKMSRKLEQWSYKKATYINAVTKGILATLVNKKDIPEQKIFFLPNGVDIHLFKKNSPNQHVQKKIGISDEIVFLYAGTHGYAQGLKIILEAASILRNEKIMFIFVGDGPIKPELIDFKIKNQLNNIKFLGSQPLIMMPQYYSITRASIITLKNVKLFKGARPSKIFPSLSSSVPVIYSGEGEGADIILEANAGLVIEPEDAESLSEAIMKLALDKDLSEMYGRNGRNYVEKNFDWSNLVDSWIKQIQDKEIIKSLNYN